MNRAHTTHYSMFPDPAIGHVLRGWGEDGAPAKHDLTLADVRVRNVATNIRDWAGGAIAHGNSIFIFEVAGMCIGHLGHLHHTLTDQQVAHIGQLDVVMVAVDGSYTMDVAGVVETLKTLRARLVLPMHYFNQFTLNRFVERIRADFPVEMATEATIVVSQAVLPRRAEGAGAAGILSPPHCRAGTIVPANGGMPRHQTNGSRKLCADFVAKVGDEIGERALRALVALFAARSGRSGGRDALARTPATRLGRYRRSHHTRGDRGRRSRHELGEPAQVLGEGCQRELEQSAARPAQS